MGKIGTVEKSVDWFKRIKGRMTSKARVFNASGEKTVIENMPYVPNWFFNAHLGQPRNINIVELRQFAKSPWVHMVKGTIVKQAIDTPWEIRTVDDDDKKVYPEIEKVTEFLKFPNSNGDTFKDVWGAYLNDTLEIDAGVIFKGRNYKQKMVEMFAFDSARFLVNMDEHGLIDGYYQYSLRHPKAQPKFFAKSDLIYGKINNNTEFFPYGFSPLQSVQQVVELLIQSTRSNKEFFKRNAIPDGLISVPMPDDQLERFKDEWLNEVVNKPHKLLFHNTPVDFKQFSPTNKDMEWLEGQKWYHHLVFAAYGLSPQEAGFYEGSSRATGESQERISVKNAISPYLSHIEDKINREIIPEFFEDKENIPIEFKFFPKDHVAEKIEHDQVMSKLNSNVYTINEVRSMEGKEPVEWGDQPMAMAMQEKAAENESKKDEKDKDEDKREVRPPKERPEDDKTERKTLEFYNEIKKKIDSVEEATDYNSFLKSQFEKWETHILKAIEDHIDAEVPAESKSFNDFVVRVFNVINTAPFRDKVKSFVSKHMKEGLEKAEVNLNLDIPMSEVFRNRMKSLADQQIEGYNIHGKRWAGIKGVGRELQNKIVQDVSESLRERKSVNQIKENIKELMAKEKGGTVNGKVTEGRTMKIARTEVTNMRNAGRLQAYQDSGVKGKKVWVTQKDDKVSKTCKSLEGQKVGLFEPFIDFQDKEYMRPAAHSNCRCHILMEAKED